MGKPGIMYCRKAERFLNQALMSLKHKPELRAENHRLERDALLPSQLVLEKLIDIGRTLAVQARFAIHEQRKGILPTREGSHRRLLPH